MRLHRVAAEIGAFLLVLVVMLFVLVMVMASGSAAVQDGGNITEQQQGGEYIDENTRLLSAELDRDTDEATIELASSDVQTIYLFDPAGYWTDGEPAQRSVRMYPGERVNLTLPLEEMQGHYAVVIETDETVHPKRLREPTQDLEFLNALRTIEGIASGAMAAFSWFIIGGVYVLWIEGGEPEVA